MYNIPIEKVQELTRAHGREYRADKAGYAVFTGDRASLKKALRVISKYYSGA